MRLSNGARKKLSAPLDLFRSEDGPYWKAKYESSCTPGCGNSHYQITAMTCVEKTGGLFSNVKEVDNSSCAGYTPVAKQCVDTSRCQWRVHKPPDDFCGWAKVGCYDDGKEKLQNGSWGVQSHWTNCEEETGVTQKEFRTAHGYRCAGGKRHQMIQDVCLMTLNAPEYERAEYVASKLNSSTVCGGADVIVIATQEMTGVMGSRWSKFPDFVRELQEKEEYLRGYKSAGSCGSKISGAVVVLVKWQKRDHFSPTILKCHHERSTATINRPGEKGTAILQLKFTGGTFVAASSHLARAGLESEKRVTQFNVAAEYISQLEPKPTVVMWGGDFNMRTIFNQDEHAVEEVVRLGLTHPQGTDVCAGQSCADPFSQWQYNFNPHAAFLALRRKPDYFGGKEQLLTVDEALESANQLYGLNLRQADVSGLCPTYYKAGAAGTWSDTSEDSSANRTWIPTFACKACPDCESEYYRTDYGGGKKKDSWEGDMSRAASTTERLFVTTGNGGSCEKAQKIVAEVDHDTVYAKCKIRTGPTENRDSGHRSGRQQGSNDRSGKRKQSGVRGNSREKEKKNINEQKNEKEHKNEKEKDAAKGKGRQVAQKRRGHEPARS